MNSLPTKLSPGHSGSVMPGTLGAAGALSLVAASEALALVVALALLLREMLRNRRHHEQLGQHEQALAETLERVDIGCIHSDRAGRVRRMNGVAEELTGWSRTEAQGHVLHDLLQFRLPADAVPTPGPDPIVELGLDPGGARQVALRASHGAVATVEIRAVHTPGRGGSDARTVWVLRPVSTTVVATTESSRLAAIVSSSTDAIIGKTLDGRITSWNDAAQTLFGYTAQEAIDQRVDMLIPADRADEEAGIIASLARGQIVPAFDTVRRARDGRLLEVCVTISPIRDARGRIVGASKIERDIGEQRRAEAALRDSEARLRFAVESAELGEWELDLSTRQVRHSRLHDRCFGHDQPLALWNADLFERQVHPHDWHAVKRSFRIALARRADWRMECRVICPDGSVHWISAHGSLKLDAGRPGRMQGIVHDITAQKEAEEARLNAERLEAQNRQIQAESRLKSQFLANMSHELRTPLNAVIGFADLLHMGAVPPDSLQHHEFLGHIGNSGRHLLQLINDVLDLSKVESGKFEFVAESLQLPTLLTQVCDVLQTAIQRKRLSVTQEIDPGLGALQLDVARLKQVLYNYLSNAIKFTPDGGAVILRALAQGPDHFRVEVQDSGIGIATNDLPRLFVEFQQLDAGYSKQHQGTGLGLALTRRLIEAQGGQVGVSSEPGVGSVFHFVLNRIHCHDLASAAAPPDRLLLIEADARAPEQLVLGLARAGFAAEPAATGEQAVRRAAQTA